MREPRFFAKHDAQVKRDGNDAGVDVQRGQPERRRPANKDERDGDVDGIARVAVQADDHQVNRRRPGRKSAFAMDIEVSDTPQKRNAADDQRNKPQRLDKLSVRRGKQPRDRNSKCDNARQRKEGQECPDKHEPLTNELSDRRSRQLE